MRKRLIILFACLLLCWGLTVPGHGVAFAKTTPDDRIMGTGLPSAAPTATSEPTATAAPTATAGPTDTPAPSPSPAPTRDPHRPMAALTFDDGPNVRKTAPLLDLLERYGVKATFFVLGTSITEETAPLLQRMADMGCEIGIHGMSHGKMSRQSAAYIEKKLRQMSELISSRIEGGYTPKLMRPPGGHIGRDLRDVTRELGLPIVLWSVDTEDWKNDLDTVLELLRSLTRDGSIILCHDKGAATLRAMEIFIPELLEQGYDLVTVSELLSRRGAPPEGGKVYLCMDP